MSFSSRVLNYHSVVIKISFNLNSMVLCYVAINIICANQQSELHYETENKKDDNPI